MIPMPVSGHTKILLITCHFIVVCFYIVELTQSVIIALSYLKHQKPLKSLKN